MHEGWLAWFNLCGILDYFKNTMLAYLSFDYLKLTSAFSLNRFIAIYTDTLIASRRVHTLNTSLWTQNGVSQSCFITLINIYMNNTWLLMPFSMGCHTPSHVESFCNLYPSLQMQTNDPMVFVQVWSQGPKRSHSSTSTTKKCVFQKNRTTSLPTFTVSRTACS